MYKIGLYIGMTIIIGMIALFQYPPYTKKNKETEINKIYKDINKNANTTTRDLNKLESLNRKEIKSKYNSSCEIELYNKFAATKSTKEFIETYIKSVSKTRSILKIRKAQNKLIKRTRYSDIYFHNLLDKNINNEFNFIEKITKRTICKINQ